MRGTDLVCTRMQIVTRRDPDRRMTQQQSSEIQVVLRHRCARQVPQRMQRDAWQGMALAASKFQVVLELMTPRSAVELSAKFGDEQEERRDLLRTDAQPLGDKVRKWRTNGHCTRPAGLGLPDCQASMLGAVILQAPSKRFGDAQPRADLQANDGLIAVSEEGARGGVAEPGAGVLRHGPVLGHGREDDADFIKVRHIDTSFAHAWQFPAVQPLAGEVALLEGELEGSFDDDSPVADGTFGEITIFERKQEVFSMLGGDLAGESDALFCTSLRPEMQDALVHAQRGVADSFDAAGSQVLFVKRKERVIAHGAHIGAFYQRLFRRSRDHETPLSEIFSFAIVLSIIVQIND